MWKRETIKGCEGRGDRDSPYLTRIMPAWEPWLHVFHRSDHGEPHDHPWNFWTLVLWQGYREHIRKPDGSMTTRRLWPGMIVYRPATHIHWVELIDGKPAVTLVLRGPKLREWGFHTQDGWEYWRTYFDRMGC